MMAPKSNGAATKRDAGSDPIVDLVGAEIDTKSNPKQQDRQAPTDAEIDAMVAPMADRPEVLAVAASIAKLVDETNPTGPAQRGALIARAAFYAVERLDLRVDPPEIVGGVERLLARLAARL
jgi:hypothetical protein